MQDFPCRKFYSPDIKPHLDIFPDNFLDAELPCIVKEQVNISIFSADIALHWFVDLLNINLVSAPQQVTDRSFKIKCFDIVPVRRFYRDQTQWV